MGGEIKEKNQMVSEENLTENGIYYKKLADKYVIAGFLVLGLLIVFLLVFCIAGHREIGIDRFRYLIKNFRLSLSAENDSYADISYTAGGVRFALYRDHLAVINSGETKLYHSSGELLFHAETGGAAVSVDTSGKYMAVYAPGSNTVALYNSFDKIHTETYEYPVSLAKVGQNGAFAVSVTEGTYSTVYFYDASFRLVYTWSSQNGTVFDISVSPDGGKVAVMTLCGISGSFYSELVVKNVKTDKTVVSEKFDGIKPIGVEFFSDGGFLTAVYGTIYFYRSDGAKIGQAAVSSGSAQYLVYGNAVAVLASPYRAVVYSNRGSAIDEMALDGKIFDIDFRENFVYFLSDTMLYIYDMEAKHVQDFRIDSGVLDFFALEDGSVLLCFASGLKRFVP